jgi:hypothetical protein
VPVHGSITTGWCYRWKCIKQCGRMYHICNLRDASFGVADDATKLEAHNGATLTILATGGVNIRLYSTEWYCSATRKCTFGFWKEMTLLHNFRTMKNQSACAFQRGILRRNQYTR